MAAITEKMTINLHNTYQEITKSHNEAEKKGLIRNGSELTLQLEHSKYQLDLQDIIGQGTVGDVYKGTSKNGSPVAIKLSKLSPRNRKFELVRYEANCLTQAQNVPHVVKLRCAACFPWDEKTQLAVIIMQRAPTSIYNTYLEKKQHLKLSLDDIFFVGRQLLEALSGLHQKNLMHCDLKPENMSWDEGTKELTLFDFGLARILNDTLHREDVGTIYYKAPEVILKKGYNQSADIWAVGCILYELCTGNVLFPAHDDSRTTLLNMIFSQMGKPPVEYIMTSELFDRYFFRNEIGIYLKPSFYPVETSSTWRQMILTSRGDDAQPLINCIERMLDYDISTRITPDEALQRFFS